MPFAVYPMPRGRTGFIVDVQSRLLEGLATRVGVPQTVVPRIPVTTLNPVRPSMAPRSCS